MKLLTLLYFIFVIKLNFASQLQEGSACITHLGTDGFCKMASTCQWIRDKNIQKKDFTLCDNTGKIICCEDPPGLSPITPTPESTTIPTTKITTIPTPKITTIPTTPDQISFNYNRIFYTKEQCQELNQESKRLHNIEPCFEGIAHGKEARACEFPFIVSINELHSNGVYEHKCGGSIISRRHILTAAHCVHLDLDLYVEKTVIKYGSVLLDEGMKEVRLGKPPYWHKDLYENTYKGYDIALLFLEDDIQMSLHSFPICLHNGEEPLQMESSCTIAGFGKLADGTSPNHLQKAEIKLKGPQGCDELRQQLFINNPLKDHQICAGDPPADSTKTSDTCQGDSGGPLFQNIGNIETHVGITSFGPGFCNSNSINAIYTGTSSFINWINDIVENDFRELSDGSSLIGDQRFANLPPK